jgi:hypothetical protein
MKTDEKIIKYLDNQLSEKEQELFEEELKNSEELRNAFQKYKSVKNSFDEIKEIESNELYFNSLLPGFRAKLGKKLKESFRKNIGIAFSVLVMFIFSFSMFNIFYDSSVRSLSLEEFTASLTEEEKIELLNSVNDELTSDYLDEASSSYYQPDFDETIISNEDKYQLALNYNIELEETAEYLSEQEFERIYNEIISMKFLSEEKL